MPHAIDATFMEAARGSARGLAGTAQDYDSLLDLVGTARIVLLGEGVPRHARVLPRARHDHAATDRGEGASPPSRWRPTGRMPTAPTATYGGSAMTPSR